MSAAKLRRGVAKGAERPAIGDRIVDIYLVGRRNKLPTQDIHLAIEVHPSRVTCSPGYGGNSVDGIGHWVIDKRVCSISESAARDICAATCVD